LDISAHQESKLDLHRGYRILLVRAWNMVWLGVLPGNGLAMARKAATGRNKSAGFIYYLLRR